MDILRIIGLGALIGLWLACSLELVHQARSKGHFSSASVWGDSPREKSKLWKQTVAEGLVSASENSISSKVTFGGDYIPEVSARNSEKKSRVPDVRGFFGSGRSARPNLP